MVEHILNDFGVPNKTGNKPRNGVKKCGQILKKFSIDHGPIPEFEEILGKERSSKAYSTFREDCNWLKHHLAPIANFIDKQLGEDKIRLSAYFIRLQKKDHDCIQIQFPYENTVLNYHYNGPNFAEYFTSTITSEAGKYRQRELLESYFKELVEYIPERQLRHINWIMPKFISGYALDSDPHLTVEMEFDSKRTQEDDQGVYSDLFIELQDEYPFFPFQPVFAGEKEETVVIILPQDSLFDVERFREQMAARIPIDPKKIMMDRRYNFEIPIMDLKYSVGLRTSHNIRIKYKNPEQISYELANDFIQMAEQGLRCAQKCTASDYLKGKNDNEMEKGLHDRIVDAYKQMPPSDLLHATFGSPKELKYFDSNLMLEMNERFQKHKKRVVGQ